MKRTFTALFVIGTILIAFSFYAVFTHPRIVVNFPVSFAIGAVTEEREFTLPVFHDQVQIKVIINEGASLWTAKILEADNVVWTHTKSQGSQTTYQSDWITLTNGNYDFIYSTAGIGSLDAEVRVTTKGGFW